MILFWISITGVVVFAVPFARLAFKFMTDDGRSVSPGDYFFASIAGFLTAWVWPITLAVYLISLTLPKGGKS